MVKPISAMLACLLLASCDAVREEPLTSEEVGVLIAACNANGGMKRAVRAWLLWNRGEWRIDCLDGARFVLPSHKRHH